MSEELIFHLVTKRKWREYQRNGFYSPKDPLLPKDETTWVECLKASQVEGAANSRFQGRKSLLMLVVDSRRLAGKMEYREVEGERLPMVEGGINLDAILDKIELIPNNKGEFEIKIEIG